MSRENYAAVLEINTAEGISPGDNDDVEDLIVPASPTDDVINQCIVPMENFCLYAEDEKLNESDIKVTVDSPQRHVETFETYVSYKVTVQSSRPEYAEAEYIVRRRYNDFLWLRNKLVEMYPTRIIPPLPNKHSLWGHLDRYAKDFIMFRMTMLHRFLNRVVKHPIISYSEHLKVFLTASLTELSSYQKSNVPGLFTKVSGGIYNMTMMCTTKEKCVEFEDIKKYITALNERLTTFEKIMCRMYKEKRELTKDMNQLSLEFEKWASSEIVLSPMLLSVAQAVSDISSIHDTVLVNPLEYIVLQPIREYLLYTESIKEALVRRDSVQAQYESAVEELQRKKLNQSSGILDPERKLTSWGNPVNKEDNSVSDGHPKLVSVAEINHDKLQIANEDLKSDLERWSVEKKHDIKRILLALSNYYIQYYQKSLNIWEDSLKKINVPLKNE